MRIEMSSSPLRLAYGQTLRIVDGVGRTVCCDEGTLWVTEEHQTGDVVLEAGACVRIKHAGLTLVQALKPASLSIA